jgi:hypothetical protein
MSSEKLASAKDQLKGDLGGSWNILEGSESNYTDLGIARRFGGSSAAYSLRDIGAMNGKVVRVRREPHDTSAGIDDEINFSANQVQSGALEDWVNGKLESTLPADSSQGLTVVVQHSLINSGTETTIKFYADSLTSGSPRFFSNDKTYKFYKGLSDNRYILQLTDSTNLIKASASDADKLPQDVTTYESVTGTLTSITVTSSSPAAAAYSLRKVDSSYSGDAVRIRRIDNTEVDVAFDSDNKVSTSSSITNVGSGDVDDTAETTLGNFLQGEADVRALFNNASYNPTASTSSNNYWRANPEIDLGTGAFTWSCDFILTDSFGVNTSRIIQTFDSASYWYWESSTRLRYQIGGSASGTTYLSSSTTIQLGRKYNMEFSRDASDNTTLKIDGVLVGTNTNTARNTGQVDVGRLAGFRLAGAAFNFNFNNGQHIYAGDGVETSNWVDTGTGGIDLSKEGSPVLFTGQGMDSFVDIWYDQAGSNDATQATAANQPKIAESGALLADGLDFDGSNDYLEADGVSSIYTGTDEAHSSFVVVNSDAATTTQYILGIGSTSASNPLRNTLFHSGGNIGWQVRDDAGTLKTDLSANPYIANQTYLVSALNSGTTIDFNTNSVINDNGTDADVGASTIDTVHIGTRANSPTGYLNGSIQELVFYATDQSANRFKIESNINNYYGLYNDANEFSANPTSAQSSVTLSNESKTGFTATIDATSETKQVAFPFVNDLVSGDDYFVSFNYTTSDSSKTVSVKPFQSAGGSNASNDTISATTNGFYGGTGDASHNGFDVNATATVLVFQTTGTSFNFTVSDLRVSRIARNGFVETWYDQSGNSRPLIQTTATEQPSIVENGGFVGGIKADVATSNSTMQNLQVSTDGTTPNFGTDDWANGGTKLGLMYVGKVIDTASVTSTCVLWGGGRGVSSFQTGGLSLQIIKAGTDSWRLTNERQGLSPTAMTATVSLNIDSDVICYGIANNRDFTIKTNDSVNSETESADLDTREGAPISLFGAYDQNSNRYYQRSSSGVCKECYLFSGDNITEVDTIATEINKHYNIYS